jgi:hypothetical protein
MLLALFSSIGFALLVAHVASADDNGSLEPRFVDEKDRQVSTTKRLPERGVNIFALGVTFLGKAEARFTEENLANLATGDSML